MANLHYVLPTSGGNFGPHVFGMRDGAKTVNSRGVPVPAGATSDIVKDEIFLHHYWTRSVEEFEAKVKRGGGIHKTDRFKPGHLAYIDAISTLDCLDALRYVASS